MDLEKVIIHQGIARAMFVSAWADEMEDQGYEFPPQTEIMDVAPKTPQEALFEAYRMVGMLEEVNGYSVLVLLYKAAKADGLSVDEMSESDLRQYAERFGHCLVIEALGHGISWFDDHEEFEIKIPDFENPLLGDDSTMDMGDKYKDLYHEKSPK